MLYSRSIMPCKGGLLALIGLLGLLGGESLAQSRYLRLDGPPRGITYGFNAAQLDDLDGDGVRDIVVGSHWANGIHVHSGSDGSEIFSMTGGPNLRTFGWSVLSPGDLDGDGLGDIVVSSPTAPSNGILTMISTKTRKISRFVMRDPGSRLGWSLATLPDIDKDGVPEIVAGAPKERVNGGKQVGAVHVFSGKTFKILRTYRASGSRSWDFGATVAVGGDVDADGFPDLLIGDAGDNSSRGSCHVISGKSGKLIRKIPGPASRGRFGVLVAWIGDQDGDKVSDLLVGAAQATTAQGKGAVYVISGKSGKTIWTITGKQQLGMALSSAGDIDGDGVEDILLGSPNEQKPGNKHTGLVLLYSGKTRKVIFSEESTPSLGSLGYAVGGNWDLDKDGKSEFWVGSLSGTTRGGALRFFTAKKLSLQADKNLLSVSKGGTQRLALDAGAQNARKLYVTLGSITGTRPGIRIGSLLLPLNRDVYQDFTLTAPNNLPLFNSVSFLDNKGRAQTQLIIPAGTPSKFKALKFHHAFLVLDFLKGKVTCASNAVPARLID